MGFLRPTSARSSVSSRSAPADLLPSRATIRNRRYSIRGWWDRNDTELDLVAVSDTARILRLGTCKRSATRLIADLPRFNGHITRFLAASPRFRSWRIEQVAVAPTLSSGERAAITSAGYIPQDLDDLSAGLLPTPAHTG